MRHVWLLALFACACAGEPPVTIEDAGVPLRGVGESCETGEDCASSLCLDVGLGMQVCSDFCDDASTCPARGWGCIRPDRFPATICGCRATAHEEICGDGVDNDCNGHADDCRLCDGVPVADDDHEHCGACGNACRADEECHAGTCRCAGPGEIDCGGRCVDTRTDLAHCGACGIVCPDLAACTDGACTCPADAATTCGDACIDTRSDPLHCGACDETCETGLACRDASCVCPTSAAPDHCAASGCVDLDDDERNCGTCGHACAAVESCVSGACVCPTAGESLCGSSCVSLTTDPTHCGSCERACGSGERCISGTCSCPGIVCGGACLSGTTTDHCGACDVSCRADQLCTLGTCACPAGRVDCGGACVAVSSDPSNCGGCGIVCGTGQTCSSGTCTCPSTSRTYCAAIDRCVDATTDEANCGACGVACGTGQTCTGGICRCPTSTPTYCAADDECVDTTTDRDDCGSCGNTCPGPTVCRSSACACAASWQTYCAATDACVDTAVDSANCGGCGNVCPASTHCASSRCVCDGAGETLCGAECFNLQTDAAHCGTCTRVCAGAQGCESGTCTCPNPTFGTDQRVSFTDTMSWAPAVASDGTHALVVWVDGAYPDEGVYAQLLNPDATPAGPTIELDVDEAREFSRPRVVWTGTEYGVAWGALIGATPQGRMIRLDATGTPLGPPIGVTDTGGVDHIALDWGPSGYAILYEHFGTVRFRLLGFDGTGAGPSVTLPWATSAYLTDVTFAAGPDGRFATSLMSSTGWVFQVIEADGSVVVPAIPFPTGGFEFASPDFLGHDGVTWYAVGHRSTSTPYRSQIVAWRGATLSNVTVLFDTTVRAQLSSQPRAARYGSTLFVAWNVAPSLLGVLRGVQLTVPTTATGGFAVRSVIHTFFPSPTVRRTEGAPLTFVGPDRLVFAWADRRVEPEEIYAMGSLLSTCR